MKALILAGGFGTRLKSKVADKPKPLAPVAGRPFLAHLLDWLAGQEVSEAVLAIHHMADQMVDFAESMRGHAIALALVKEHEPLGTGGAIRHAFENADLGEDFMVLNGDTFFELDLGPARRHHQQTGNAATILGARVDDVARFGTMTVQGDLVRGFEQANGRAEPGIVNSGAYFVNRRLFDQAPEGAFSIEKDLFPQAARAGMVSAWISEGDGRFFDIGTPESYEAFCRKMTGIE